MVLTFYIHVVQRSFGYMNQSTHTLHNSFLWLGDKNLRHTEVDLKAQI